jgi:hypothetical protein
MLRPKGRIGGFVEGLAHDLRLRRHPTRLNTRALQASRRMRFSSRNPRDR